MSHDFETPLRGRPLTERDLWIRYTGKPKPNRWEHNKVGSTTCEFCRREKLWREKAMTTSPFEVIECASKDEWLKKRREGVGASDVADVLFDPVKLWSEKVGIMELDAESSEAMELGLHFQQAIADFYMQKTERLIVSPGEWTIYRSKAHPCIQATLDYEIAPIDDRGPGVLEVKLVGAHNKAEWKEEPPVAYQFQHEAQLLTTGYRWGSLAAVLGGTAFVWADREANKGVQDYLVQKVEAFWELVIKEEPPSPDGSEAYTELLKRLFPRPAPGQVIALPGEFIEIDREYQEIKAQIKTLESREAELKNRICAAIGGAEIGALPNGDSYKWSHVHKVIPAHGEYEQNYRTLTRKAKKGTR